MMQNTDFQKTEYWTLFRDLVTFLRRSLPIQADNEQYWVDVCQEAVGIAERYKDGAAAPLCNAVLHALMDELGRLYDNEKMEVGLNAVS